jgi:hypothetical protein
VNKKDYEKHATDRLKELYSDFPEGSIEYGEEPDVRVKQANGCTGIEVTDYFRPESNQGLHFKSKSR